MSELVKKKNQNIDELNEARRLRQRAGLLEQKSHVRARLRQLMEVSKDPYYDRYLAQMMKDLESGKATPEQVEREAQRSYYKYRQRMAQIEQKKIMDYPPPGTAADVAAISGQNLTRIANPVVEPSTWRHESQERKSITAVSGAKRAESERKKNIEFKVGVHVFSMLGAAFVLMAFVIFGFYFLNGLVQGLCLYGTALVLTIISQLILWKKKGNQFSYKFWYVITGIGIGGLYAANLINYLALHTINGVTAMVITLVIAVGALFLSRKKDSAAIRIIGLMGCYICFLPVQGIQTDFEFLMISAMLLFINVWSVFAEKRNGQSMADIVHLALNLVFTFIFMRVTWSEDISVVYRVLYVITSFAFVNIFSLKKCIQGNTFLFSAGCIVNGIYIYLLFMLGNFALEVKGQPEMALFVHLIMEALVISICGVIFLLWPKDSGRRWAQLYYGVSTVLLVGSFSNYPLEIVLCLLVSLLITKIFAGHKEMIVLDCIVVFWVGIRGFLLMDSWYCWLLAIALILSAVRIKYMYLYHEIVITISILLICWSAFSFYLYKEYDLGRGWLYPVSAGLLLILFLLFNHLPGLKDKNQQVYNRINLVFMLLYYLGVWFCQSYVLSSIMMVMGAAAMIIVFRKRYSMELSGKYLILVGFLTYFTLTGHYGSPVIVSIFLMVISLFCVGVGFKFSDKKERICGLVMAAFVCLKLIVYDFREVGAAYRVIVFFAVGIIALLISFIYVKLEKISNNLGESVGVETGTQEYEAKKDEC